MEFQNVGKHCSESTCRQIDFLPFTCKFCEKIFCLDHRDTTSHQCPKANIGDHQAIICPVCRKTLTFDVSTMSRDEYWEIHYATECKPKETKDDAKICPGYGCKTKLTPLNSQMCRGCRKHLCLKHRYEDQHYCFIEADPKFVPKPQVKKETVAPAPKQITIENAFSRQTNNQPKTNNNQPKPNVEQPKPNTNTNVQQKPNCSSDYIEEFCPVCGKGFANLDELIGHAQTAHY